MLSKILEQLKEMKTISQTPLGDRIEYKGKEFLLVFKTGHHCGYLPMATFLNTVDSYSGKNNGVEKVFFISDGRFSIDHINAVDKKLIENTIFIQEMSKEAAADSIVEYLEKY